MSLRPFFIASSLILSPLAAIGFGSAAFAQATSTSNIPLGITVPARATINAVATSQAANLENAIQFSQVGLQYAKIADFTVSTNVTTATLTTTSTNAGALKNSNNDTIPYKIAVSLDGSLTQPFEYKTLENYSFPFGNNSNLDLHIEINNTGSIKAGTYSDTLTLTLSAGS
ncbi:spore coat protein U domain-containing protein [Aphanizomenon sp. UHCC 0183]|uniref:spore coat protein U domain-containing protein n=1 Tax=Aphanizomenon sp. UHCC 0183 TaxID=2590028 RepID=UPI00144697B8|nr:spore coat protein U domain-containing protein [Aphanizomenon sp. UHCC 0183]MTJ31655.1 hypothetical protein [Aphanizomenon sp. UHCC 0183]